MLFVVSGALLWLGERNHGLRLSGTITVHDGTMFLAVGLLLGHLWLALVWPPTRHAMRGITLGTVRADWALRHHAKWATAVPVPQPSVRPGRASVTVGLVAVAAGTWGAVALARDATAGLTKPATAATLTTAGDAPSPPAPAGSAIPEPDPAASPLRLAAEAQQLEQAGDDAAAIRRYRLAVRRLPGRGDIRTALGLALARAGDPAGAVTQLRRALQTKPAVPEARLYLGAVLLRANRAAEGRRQLRRYLRAHPTGPPAAYARSLLVG